MNFIFKICIIPSVAEHSGYSKAYLALFLEIILSGVKLALVDTKRR